MEENKTKYLKNLEMLMQTYETCYGDCVGDRIINKLSLLIVMYESAEIFNQIAKGLKENFIIDIDRDVNYSHWGKPETWTSKKTKKPSTNTTLTFESLNMEMGSTFANNLADMLPPLPLPESAKKDNKEQEGLTYSGREPFKDTINNLINRNVFNDNMLDYSINKTLQRLCTALQTIDKIINSKLERRIYEQLYDNQRFAYNVAIGTWVKSEYDNWKNRFLGDEISEETLKERTEKEIVKIVEAQIFSDIEVNVSKKKREEHKKEIDFDEHEVPKEIQPYEQYTRFRDIYHLKEGRYTIDKEKAGRYLFRTRKDTAKLEAFFRFDEMLALIYADIKELMEKNKVDSVMEGIDFSQLECRFTKEQVKSCGIKYEAETVLALIDILKEGEHKAYWLCFFCVLLEKKWIDDNLSKFCKSMDLLFEIGLDKASLNKEKKNNGINIESWPENDERIKTKKDFGLKFKACIDYYLEYKRQLVWADM